MLLACITLHQLYYITSSLHHLDALHHLTSEYSNRVNLMYYTRCHMYYMGFTFTDASRTMHRVNDRWSTRSGVRVSAPDIAVDGSDRRRRGHQREVRPV